MLARIYGRIVWKEFRKSFSELTSGAGSKIVYQRGSQRDVEVEFSDSEKVMKHGDYAGRGLRKF